MSTPHTHSPLTPSFLEPIGREAGSRDGSRWDGVDVVAVGFADSLDPSSRSVLAELGVSLTPALTRTLVKVGDTLTLPTAAGPVLVLVARGSGEGADLRRAAAALARQVKGLTLVESWLGVSARGADLAAYVAGLVLGGFGYRLGAAQPEAHPAHTIRVVTAASAEDFAGAQARARAAWLARELCWVPSNIKNPPWLADRAVAVGAESGLEVEVWDETTLAEAGMGGIAAVGRASDSPPRFVQVRYTPDEVTERTPHIVLVGKGITFDTGGLSIKPGEMMVAMKRDMTGAAVVLGVLSALRALGCRAKVTGLLCLAENSISGRAMRPGDVITQYGGRTCEVNDTDAEGRLVLADGLAYAVAELNPTTLVDVATLTGAMKVALGQRMGGLFATTDSLANQLLRAGDRAGEPLWRLPLADEYEPKLASKVADAMNAPGGPGAVVAALYLQHFVGGLPWAHLDVASAGDSPDERFEWTKGPTGYGVRLLLQWLAPA